MTRGNPRDPTITSRGLKDNELYKPNRLTMFLILITCQFVKGIILQLKQLITNRAYVMTEDQAQPDSTVVTDVSDKKLSIQPDVLEIGAQLQELSDRTRQARKGIDQLKLHYVQLGYLKNLPKPIQTKVYQETSVGKHSTTTQLCRSHQSSSSCDLHVRRLSRPSQGSVVFRHNDSAGHHIQKNVGPFRHDDSAGRSHV
ncbi:beta-glucosidase 18-like [Dorcoceras hygrometricum]|uniref:Beta-glucosidase 18-like n=1 Tax=Dorcoceras hygrometricum TaxID=472368 RepID=A0A2Z7ANX6_9LAMI|nr:beta-glucosidase 18-like [Dorcoceras hygrometricum]